jgi:hypothetical protein
MFGKLTGRDLLAFGVGLNTSIVAMDFILWNMVPEWDLSLTPFNIGVILSGGYILCTTGDDYVRRDSDEHAGDCQQVGCKFQQDGSELKQDV